MVILRNNYYINSFDSSSYLPKMILFGFSSFDFRTNRFDFILVLRVCIPGGLFYPSGFSDCLATAVMQKLNAKATAYR